LVCAIYIQLARNALRCDLKNAEAARQGFLPPPADQDFAVQWPEDEQGRSGTCRGEKIVLETRDTSDNSPIKNAPAHTEKFGMLIRHPVLGRVTHGMVRQTI
jgi:hypothetical protein